MKKQYFAMLLLVALLLTACAAPPQETQPPTEPTPPPATEPATEPETVPPTEAVVLELPEDAPEGSQLLTPEKLADYEALFTQDRAENAPINWYNRILTCHFHDPKQIDLRQLFSSGCGYEEPVTDAEMEFLKTQPQINCNLEIKKIPKEQLRQVVETYLHLKPEEMESFVCDNMAYFPETEMYFCNPDSKPVAWNLKFVNGYVSGETGATVLYYNINGGPNHILHWADGKTPLANFWPEADDPYIPLTQEEIHRAMQTVVDEFEVIGATLTDVWYDRTNAERDISLFMRSTGKAQGISRNDVVTIYGNFHIAEGTDNPTLSAGAYEAYHWVLVRDGNDGTWRIADRGPNMGFVIPMPEDAWHIG